MKIEPGVLSFPSATEGIPVAESKVQPAAAADGPSPFARMLKGLGDEVTKGEKAIRGAEQAVRMGRDLGAAELLALQSGVYRYSTAVDLATKLVEKTTTAVKTVIQSGQ